MEKIIESIENYIDKYNKMTDEERAIEDERLPKENQNVMVCWCCEHFVLRDKTLQGGCKLKWKMVPAFQVICPDFILNSGVFSKRKMPDYCTNYKNNEN